MQVEKHAGAEKLRHDGREHEPVRHRCRLNDAVAVTQMQRGREGRGGQLENDELEEVTEGSPAEPADREVIDADAVPDLDERLILVFETDHVDFMACQDERACLPGDPRVVRVVRVADDADPRHQAPSLPALMTTSGARTAPPPSPRRGPPRATVAARPCSRSR